MKLVTISGPRGAGKDTIQEKLVCRFNGRLHRVLACTTRPPRPTEAEGREYYFVSEEQFDNYLAADQLAFWTTISPTQRSGTLWSEFDFGAGILNIVPEGARQMRQLMERIECSSLLVYVHASEEDRLRRIRLRQPEITAKAARDLLIDDPVSPDPNQHTDFDVVVANCNGSLEQVTAYIAGRVEEFINS